MTFFFLSRTLSFSLSIPLSLFLFFCFLLDFFTSFLAHYSYASWKPQLGSSQQSATQPSHKHPSTAKLLRILISRPHYEPSTSLSLQFASKTNGLQLKLLANKLEGKTNKREWNSWACGRRGTRVGCGRTTGRQWLTQTDCHRIRGLSWQSWAGDAEKGNPEEKPTLAMGHKPAINNTALPVMGCYDVTWQLFLSSASDITHSHTISFHKHTIQI